MVDNISSLISIKHKIKVRQKPGLATQACNPASSEAQGRKQIQDLAEMEMNVKAPGRLDETLSLNN